MRGGKRRHHPDGFQSTIMMKQEVRREGGRTAVLDVGHDLDEARGAGGVQLAGLQDRRPNLAHLRAGDANRPLHNPHVHLSPAQPDCLGRKKQKLQQETRSRGRSRRRNRRGRGCLRSPRRSWRSRRSSSTHPTASTAGPPTQQAPMAITNQPSPISHPPVAQAQVTKGEEGLFLNEREGVPGSGRPRRRRVRWSGTGVPPGRSRPTHRPRTSPAHPNDPSATTRTTLARGWRAGQSLKWDVG